MCIVFIDSSNLMIRGAALERVRLVMPYLHHPRCFSSLLLDERGPKKRIKSCGIAVSLVRFLLLVSSFCSSRAALVEAITSSSSRTFFFKTPLSYYTPSNKSSVRFCFSFLEQVLGFFFLKENTTALFITSKQIAGNEFYYKL